MCVCPSFIFVIRGIFFFFCSVEQSTFLCWLDTGRWSSVAWYTMHYTTIHKKYIKFKFRWIFFFFCLLARITSVLLLFSLDLCMWVSESFCRLWWYSGTRAPRSIQLLLMSFVYENEHYFYPFHWIMFLVARIFFYHWISGVSSFSHTNANDSKYIVRLDGLEMLFALVTRARSLPEFHISLNFSPIYTDIFIWKLDNI